MSRAPGVAACGAGALVAYLAFWAGREWGDDYTILYGRFGGSVGELAFRLNLLLFVLPATVLAAAAVARRRQASDRLLAGFDALERRAPSPMILAALALLAVVLVVLARVAVLQGPITDDENVYVFQARLLATGRLWIPSLPEPVRAFFDNQFIINDGRWFGMYFPGHPLVLAAALRVGLMDYAGAIEAGLALPLAVGVARRLFGIRAAWLTAALLLLSPFFIFVSATLLSQTTSSLCLALLLYAAVRVEEHPRRPGWWMVGGAALGFMGLVRPQAAVVLALPVLGRLAWLLGRRAVRPGWVPVAGGLAVVVGAMGVFLALNDAVTGSPLRTPYHAYWEHVRPFHARTGPLYPLRELAENVTLLNFWLFGWPLSLGFAPLFRRQGAAWAVAGVPVAALLAQALTGVPTVAAVGPVYFAETIIPLAVLSASGLERAVRWARATFADGPPARLLAAWPLAAVLACLAAFLPVEVASLRRMAAVARAPYDLVERFHLQHALVFVHSLPALHVRPGAWVYYHRNPSPDLSDPVLFVRFLGEHRNRQLMAYFPDRTPYAMGMRDGRLHLIPLRPGPPTGAR